MFLSGENVPDVGSSGHQPCSAWWGYSMTGPLHPGRLWMSKAPSDSDIRGCMKQRFSRAQGLAMTVPRFATYMADINTTDTAVAF